MDWDLPNPQGPLIGHKKITSVLLPSDKCGMVVYMPNWFGIIASRDDVVASLTNTVRFDGDDRFIAGDGWPIRNHNLYAGMFLCRHVLNALRLRANVSKGTMDYLAVERALAAWLHAYLPPERGGPHRKIRDESDYSEDPELQAQIKRENNSNPDRVARVRKLLRLAEQRLSGEQPAALRVKRS